MAWTTFKDLKIIPAKKPKIKNRYSVSTDIVLFQRCPRHYGFYEFYKFLPSAPRPIYFGSLLHEVLNRIHKHYFGVPEPRTKGAIPTDEEIDQFILEVENTLRARGYPLIRKSIIDAAKRLLILFNKIEGPSLYPRVIDTEHRLSTTRKEYIITGAVDLLVGSKNEIEIWDYKGTHRPEPDSEMLRRYEFQMRLYSELYRMRHDKYPDSARMYFLSELDRKPTPKKRPEEAIHQVDLDRKKMKGTLEEFDQIVGEIEACREKGVWPSPTESKRPEEICDFCDFRWSCRGSKYSMRYP